MYAAAKTAEEEARCQRFRAIERSCHTVWDSDGHGKILATVPTDQFVSIQFDPLEIMMRELQAIVLIGLGAVTEIRDLHGTVTPIAPPLLLPNHHCLDCCH